MRDQIISYDLGTSGNKASLYDTTGNCLASAFVPYDTFYPETGWHEQRPEDWWRAVVESTHLLLEKSNTRPNQIACLGISGHSLGTVPIDKNGFLLRENTPIWSDTRAQKEVEEFFTRIDEQEWYLRTGNGFPAACYTLFKIMWYKNHEVKMFQKVYKIIGTKDYINFKLSGVIKTDYSYASGCGAYDLKKWAYHTPYIQAGHLDEGIFPEIVPSTQVLGSIQSEVADILGLDAEVKVVCGGVDNSCMALGAKNIKQGRVYTSLGSSAWIAVSASEPVLDVHYRPYVFAHVIPGMFTSAVSIFSAGTSLRWVRDQLCVNIKTDAIVTDQDSYELMNQEAEKSPIGANKLLFNPSLAGGNSQDPSPNLRGAFIGLDLKHEQSDIIRASMEGIAMNLRLRLDLLKKYIDTEEDMLIVGGGSKSRLFRKIFADIYYMNILRTNIDQDAAALGAATIAAVGSGFWKNFNKIDDIHQTLEILSPNPEDSKKYEEWLEVFKVSIEDLSKISDRIANIGL